MLFCYRQAFVPVLPIRKCAALSLGERQTVSFFLNSQMTKKICWGVYAKKNRGEN